MYFLQAMIYMVVIVALPFLAGGILYALVPSNAEVASTKEGFSLGPVKISFRFGGASAVAIFVFLVLIYLVPFSRVVGVERDLGAEIWKVTGDVDLSTISNDHGRIRLAIQPPPAELRPTGRIDMYVLRRTGAVGERVFPILVLESKDCTFQDVTIPLGTEKPPFGEDYELQHSFSESRIRIGKRIRLTRTESQNGCLQ